MNGRIAKMLRKMQANDKRSKRLWNSLTSEQRSKVTATYNKYEDKAEGALKAVATMVAVKANG